MTKVDALFRRVTMFNNLVNKTLQRHFSNPVNGLLHRPDA